MDARTVTSELTHVHQLTVRAFKTQILLEGAAVQHQAVGMCHGILRLASGEGAADNIEQIGYDLIRAEEGEKGRCPIRLPDYLAPTAVQAGVTPFNTYHSMLSHKSFRNAGPDGRRIGAAPRRGHL